MTLKDIAKAAGVDASTVSRAINHPEKVRGETLARISWHIKRLDYQPNFVARGLQKAKSNLIAIVVPNFSNLAFANLMKGFHDALKGTGYELIVCSSLEDPKEEIDICLSLARQRVSGIAFISTVSTYDQDIPFHIFKGNTEVLVIDREVSDEDVGVFLLDVEKGIRMVFNHLIQLGHNHLGIIIGQQRSIHSINRLALIRRIVSEMDVHISDAYIREGDWSSAGGWQAMEHFLTLKPRPTAVFAITDTMAMGAIGAACEAGLRVPEDISVVGFNNEPGSESFNPPLTTMGPHSYNIGMQAGKHILSALESDYHIRVFKKFPLDLIIRRSTAVAPRM